MLAFMDHVQAVFHHTTAWNVDNSYASLTTTASNLLDFSLPHGIKLNVSSLSSPNFATSYTLGSRGVVDGSLSFLYTSLGLQIANASRSVHLNEIVRGYRHLQQLVAPKGSTNPAWLYQRNSREEDSGRKDTLLYGRLYLPNTTLEALYLRRISPTRLLNIKCVSDRTLPNGGTLLASLQSDYGKYSTEYLYSTDSCLVGIRGLYNLGCDPRFPLDEQHLAVERPRHPWDHQNGRLSAGAEAYFSPINKSGGISTGIRFTTLPIHKGFPYTMTLTLNPLMGNLSSTYAVKAGANLALSSRFDFNVYSYESDVTVGLELWRRRSTPPEVMWAKKLLRDDWARPEDNVTGILKARFSDKGKLGVVWESRVKELLISIGAGVDLKKRERMLAVAGLEISYSS